MGENNNKIDHFFQTLVNITRVYRLLAKHYARLGWFFGKCILRFFMAWNFFFYFTTIKNFKDLFLNVALYQVIEPII
jgi:hypothetical protein